MNLIVFVMAILLTAILQVLPTFSRASESQALSSPLHKTLGEHLVECYRGFSDYLADEKVAQYERGTGRVLKKAIDEDDSSTHDLPSDIFVFVEKPSPDKGYYTVILVTKESSVFYEVRRTPEREVTYLSTPMKTTRCTPLEEVEKDCKANKTVRLKLTVTPSKRVLIEPVVSESNPQPLVEPKPFTIGRDFFSTIKMDLSHHMRGAITKERWRNPHDNVKQKEGIAHIRKFAKSHCRHVQGLAYDAEKFGLISDSALPQSTNPSPANTAN